MRTAPLGRELVVRANTEVGRSFCRSGAALLLLSGLVVFPIIAGAQQTGNYCIRDFQPGAVCTANDVRIEQLTIVQILESCTEGTYGEAEIIFEALVSAAGSPDRFDIGLFIALDGGSARDGNNCFHDYLPPPLDPDPIYGDANGDFIDDLSAPPWWDGEGLPDTCGDLETDPLC